jgi:hypothetical protein
MFVLLHTTKHKKAKTRLQQSISSWRISCYQIERHKEPDVFVSEFVRRRKAAVTEYMSMSEDDKLDFLLAVSSTARETFLRSAKALSKKTQVAKKRSLEVGFDQSKGASQDRPLDSIQVESGRGKSRAAFQHANSETVGRHRIHGHHSRGNDETAFGKRQVLDRS